MPKPNMLEAVFGPELLTILQEMEEIYPANTPDPNDTHATIMYRAGQRSVVEWLTKRISENN